MKRACALGASIFLLCAAPAVGQVYPGQEVTVNPSALGRGYLLYPGGKYGRLVPHLLQPGEKPAQAVRLHMPDKHPKVARRAKPAATREVASTAPLTVPDNAAPPPKPRKHTAPAPAAPPAATADINSMPEDSAGRLVSPSFVAAPPPKPRRAASPSSVPRLPANTAANALVYNEPTDTTPAPPRRVASTTPAPAASAPVAVDAGLRKLSVIPFAVGESSPANADVTAVHALATKLNAALNAGAARVQLQAYGGPRGDKSSDSRRLSLKRALVIRELLIEDGVPSEKIDVRAMGGVDDNGVPDRVDVYTRA
jgi:outer membrane protein OmpA-like peptidoglycan-associated protein